MHSTFWYITMLELQLSGENVERWVRQDPRFSGYLKQALLKCAMATVYVKDGQERSDLGKENKVNHLFWNWFGVDLFSSITRISIIASTIEIRKRIYYTGRSFPIDLLLSVLTGLFQIQTCSQLQCTLLSLVTSFSWPRKPKCAIKLYKEIDMKGIKNINGAFQIWHYNGKVICLFYRPRWSTKEDEYSHRFMECCRKLFCKFLTYRFSSSSI